MIKKSMCIYCKHLEIHTARCDAYPKGIPREILYEGEMHVESRGDDKGIVFELYKEEERGYVMRNFLWKFPPGYRLKPHKYGFRKKREWIFQSMKKYLVSFLGK